MTKPLYPSSFTEALRNAKLIAAAIQCAKHAYKLNPASSRKCLENAIRAADQTAKNLEHAISSLSPETPKQDGAA